MEQPHPRQSLAVWPGGRQLPRRVSAFLLHRGRLAPGSDPVNERVVRIARPMLAKHHIAEITFHPLIVYPRPIGFNSQGGPHGKDQQVTACRLTTDQGVSGWGFCGASEDSVRPFIGQCVGNLFAPETGTVPAARTIDIALTIRRETFWGLPVWRMLGAKGGSFIPVYSGAIYFDDLIPKARTPAWRRYSNRAGRMSPPDMPISSSRLGAAKIHGSSSRRRSGHPGHAAGP